MRPSLLCLVRSAALVFVAASPLLACSDDPKTGCFVGDPSKPPELVMIHMTPAGSFVETVANGEVPLIQAPQGGKVLFVGARARNIDGCPVRISASLRDECNNGLLALEQRDVTMKLAADGWLEPEDPAQISNYSNLPACPRAAAARNIQGEPYLLKVRLEDRAGRTAESVLKVTPTCAQPELLDQCVCECDAKYILGDSCGAPYDAGVPAGTCP